jgi:hypothetical protein
MRHNTSTVEDRIRSGGLLTIPEFCGWASISRVTAYKQIAKGQLKAVKNGRSTNIAGADAVAYVAALRGIAA